MSAKRVIALSDSHGCVENLRDAVSQALRAGRMDALVFLGDGLSDFERVRPLVQAECPDAALYAVRGNNDWRFLAPGEAEFSLCGIRFYACHGHEQRVKYGLDRLSYAARERDAQIALYGHTHRSHLETAYGIYFINPGAVCERGPRRSAYADIRVEETGAVRADLIDWA